MQGILKSNHQRLIDSLQEAKLLQSGQDHNLILLENELCSVFKNYLQKMNELKYLVYVYEEKERLMKIELKKIKKQKTHFSKKIGDLVLNKAVF